jgi:hypothetical protein
MEYIAFDAQKHYTLASVTKPDGRVMREERIEHDRGALHGFLIGRGLGAPVTVEDTNAYGDTTEGKDAEIPQPRSTPKSGHRSTPQNRP